MANLGEVDVGGQMASKSSLFDGVEANPQEFGGDWTAEKLRLLSEYLTSYNKVLSKMPLQRWYVDAFAGSGHSVSGPEGELIHGSPLRALSCVPKFDKLLLIEAQEKNFLSLRKHVEADPDWRKRAHIRRGDANELLVKFCDAMRPNWRAVVFLDPFAMQVPWSTLEKLAATQKCDVWILFPLSSVNRLLTRSGVRDPSWNRKLNDVLGSSDWETEFYKPTGMNDLFDQTPTQCKAAGFDDIVSFYHQRLMLAFKGGVANNWKTLCNSRGSPLFALMFALGNPSPAARKAALAIANHLLVRA